MLIFHNKITSGKKVRRPFIGFIMIIFVSHLICGCKSTKRDVFYNDDKGWESIDSKLKTKYQSKLAIYATVFSEDQEIVSFYHPNRLTLSKNVKIEIKVVEDNFDSISVTKGQDMPVIHKFESIGNDTFSILLSDFFCSNKYDFDLASLALYIHTVKGEYFLMELDVKNYDKKFICD